MRVQQSGIFKRRIKKLHRSEKNALDDMVRSIMNNPALGLMKSGNLAGVQVYKYKLDSQMYLLAYQYSEEQQLLTLLALGTHENFYRDLKRK